MMMIRNLLTKAEMRVLNGILAGATNEQIAEVMRRSLQTIKNQVVSIFNKYDVNSRSELIIATLKEDMIRWDHSRHEWFKEQNSTKESTRS